MENSEKQNEVSFQRGGLDYSMYYNPVKNKWLAKAIQPTPKGKYSKSKLVFFYSFTKEEIMRDYVEKHAANREANLKRIADDKAAKSNAKKELVNPFKVGDLFYDSWGYDQTNIDFYQIVEVGKKSVVWRRIGSKPVEGSQGFMCQEVMPAKDCFLSRYEPETKVLQVMVNRDGSSLVYIKSRHGWVSKISEDSKHYESWYA